MNTRTIKKILARKQHPKHKEVSRRAQSRIEQHARAQCRKIGISEDKWGTAALTWPVSSGG
jgi:hypothetical protein